MDAQQVVMGVVLGCLGYLGRNVLKNETDKKREASQWRRLQRLAEELIALPDPESFAQFSQEFGALHKEVLAHGTAYENDPKHEIQDAYVKLKVSIERVKAELSGYMSRAIRTVGDVPEFRTFTLARDQAQQVVYECEKRLDEIDPCRVWS